MGNTKEKEPPDPNRVRLNIWIARDAHNGFSYLAKLDQRTISDLVREAMRNYLDVHADRLMGDIGGQDG